MKINIRPKLIERLEAINWFANCGQPFHLNVNMDILLIGSWERAIQCYHDTDWEEAILEARNRLTIQLMSRCKSDFQQWNKVVGCANIFLEAKIRPKLIAIKDFHDLDNKFLTLVDWDLTAALMQDAYSHCQPTETFFPELLNIYEAGHYPCGWDGGVWPQGKLIIF